MVILSTTLLIRRFRNDKYQNWAKNKETKETFKTRKKGREEQPNLKSPMCLKILLSRHIKRTTTNSNISCTLKLMNLMYKQREGLYHCTLKLMNLLYNKLNERLYDCTLKLMNLLYKQREGLYHCTLKLMNLLYKLKEGLYHCTLKLMNLLYNQREGLYHAL